MKKLLFNCLWLLPTLTWAVPNAWLEPTTITLLRDTAFELNLNVNSNSLTVGAYSFVITLDPTKLKLDTTYQDASGLCMNGVCPGSNALASIAFNVDATGSTITLIGTDPFGVGPGNDLQLLSLHFRTRLVTGTTPVTLTTTALNNASGGNIGLEASGATVNVSYGLCGDSGGNGIVNIVDVLAISRKLINLPPTPTIDVTLADVNKDGRISNLDAIQIIRYYVGLVTPTGICAIGQPL